MFYRPSGGRRALNRQQDYVYSDTVNSATGWLPINKGDTVAINVSRATLEFVNAAQSRVNKSSTAPEAIVVLEMKMFGQDPPWTIDSWSGMLVSTSRRMLRAGWVRLRINSINNTDGSGVCMALQVSRTGDTGAVT